MQPSKIRFRLKAQLSRFTSELTIGLSKPLRNFIGEMLFGIQASQDVKLSSIARSLQEEIALLKTENRLSRNLHAEAWETHLRQGLLRLGSRRFCFASSVLIGAIVAVGISLRAPDRLRPKLARPTEPSNVQLRSDSYFVSC